MDSKKVNVDASNGVSVNMDNAKYQCEGMSRVDRDGNIADIHCYINVDKPETKIEFSNIIFSDTDIDDGNYVINNLGEGGTPLTISTSHLYANLKLKNVELEDMEVFGESEIRNSQLTQGKITNCKVSDIISASKFICDGYSELKDSEEVISDFSLNGSVQIIGSKLSNATTINGNLYPAPIKYPDEYPTTIVGADISNSTLNFSSVNDSHISNSSIQNSLVTNKSTLTNTVGRCSLNVIFPDNNCKFNGVTTNDFTVTDYDIVGGEFTHVTANAVTGDGTHLELKNSSVNLANITNCPVENSIIVNTVEKSISCKKILNSPTIQDAEIAGSAEIEASVVKKSYVSGKVLNSTVENGSYITGVVEGGSTINLGNVSGHVFGGSRVIEGSDVTATGIVENISTVAGASTVKGRSIAGKLYSKSLIDVDAILNSAIITNTKLTGDARVSTDKTNNICDGINDYDPEDSCIKEVQP